MPAFSSPDLDTPRSRHEWTPFQSSSPLSSPPHPNTPQSLPVIPSSRDAGTHPKLQPQSDFIIDASPRNFAIESIYRAQPANEREFWQPKTSLSSSSGNQLLTPHSPTTSGSYVGLYNQNANPETPSRQGHARLQPRSTPSVDPSSAGHGRLYTKPPSLPSSQLTPPASSPLQPSTSGRVVDTDISTPMRDNILTPRALTLGSPRLEPAHIITSSRSTSSIRSHPPANSPLTKLKSPSVSTEQSILLPAFVASPKRTVQTPRLHKRVSPDGLAPRIGSVEDVVDDVFRLGSLTRLAGGADSPRAESALNRKTQTRLANQGTSEPRMPRSEHSRSQASSRPETERRPNLFSSVRSLTGSPTPEHSARSGEHTTSSISFSPIKGRRIQLTRPVSPTSPPTSAPSSPRVTVAPASIPSAITMWLQSAPLAQSRCKILPPSEIAEHDSRKRKRLSAFVDSNAVAISNHKSPLKPVIVKGIGRIALDPKHIVEIVVTPAKRPGSKKRGGKKVGSSVVKKKVTAFGIEIKEDNLKPSLTRGSDEDASNDIEVADDVLAGGDDPGWLDSVYPWSEAKRRQKDLSAVDQRKLQQLENFFDRDTDDEDYADDMDRIGTVVSTADQSSTASTRPLLVRSASMLESEAERSKPPLDEADARSALRNVSPSSTIKIAKLQKPTLRDGTSILLRTPMPAPRNRGRLLRQPDDDLAQSTEPEEDDGVIKCVCGTEHADTPMVRCDSCHTWSHLDCLGIEDESQLGTHWFCFECAEPTENLGTQVISHVSWDDNQSLSPPREPVLVFTEPMPVLRTTGAPRFHDPALADSPLSSGLGLEPKAPITPRTGVNKSGDFVTPYSNWDITKLVNSDNRTPRTPTATRILGSRLFTTPKLSGDQGTSATEAFDPMSTPSRGIQFSTPFHNSSSSDRTWAFGQTPVTPTNRFYFSASAPRSIGGRNSLSKPLTFYPSEPLSYHSSDSNLFSSSYNSRYDELPSLPASPLFRDSIAAHPPISNESAIRTGSASDDEQNS